MKKQPAKKTVKAEKHPLESAYVLGLGTTVTGTGLLGSIGVLSFQGLKKMSKVGKSVSKKNIDTTTPETKLYFLTDEGVESLIQRLIALRNGMLKAAIEEEKKLAGIKVKITSPKKGKSNVKKRR